MSYVDVWACVTAGMAAVALGLRANMLKPHHQTWAPAPAPVWIPLMILAITMGMTAVSIGSSRHATAREAVVYTVLAISACCLLWNIVRNGRLDEATRRQIREMMSGPVAKYEPNGRKGPAS